MRLYHFTSTTHLPLILRDGYLRTTESNADLRPGHEHARPDVVWLLDTPELDGLPHGLAGSVVDKTAVRFTIDMPKYRAAPWGLWVEHHRVDLDMIAALVKTGGGLEAAGHWWVSEGRIVRKFWTSIRVEGVDIPVL